MSRPNLPTTRPTREDCIYAAGFFDGEGSAGTYPQHGKVTREGRQIIRLKVGVTQKDRRPLLFLKARWGGSLGSERSNGVSYWDITGKWALRFLRDILPFLRVKEANAEKLITKWKDHLWSS